MEITKTAIKKENYLKPIYCYDSARCAFECVLEALKKYGNYTLLLPGYIGISPMEGSGIFDPVLHTGISYEFYEMDKELQIDIDSLECKISEIEGKKALLLVHYFGYVDSKIDYIAELCKSNDIFVIEDAAHGLYTDFIDNYCGQYGDCVIYSFHKMLPFNSGGGLKINSCKLKLDLNFEDRKVPIFDYDLRSIANIRKRNAKLWYELLKDNEEEIHILRQCNEKVTPQTFPIVIKKFDRNELYFKLNEMGYGAVSLYHTMIEPIRKKGLSDAIYLSEHIINMPVHQDVDEEKIHMMAEELIKILK